LAFTLHQLSSRGDIPRMPIFVDSPLAVNVTEVFGCTRNATMTRYVTSCGALMG
jgi:hypothetical protein